MERHSVPGVIVAIVQGVDVLVCEGYGFADIEGAVPVDPEVTRFRAGSISKTVTATGIMKLVEEWQLTIDEDVLEICSSVDVPLKHATPVSAHHLLTHTSGFGISDIGDAVRKPEHVLSLESFLGTSMTAQEYAPGRFFVYSNQGYTLLGLVIEEFANKPFSEAIAHLVLNPMCMTNTTFEQAGYDAPGANIATGYELSEGSLIALPYDYSQVSPADGMISTARDMARFMIVHLNEGAAEDATLLRRETIAQMHARQFSHHKDMPGRTYGFEEELFSVDRNTPGRRRALSHTGGQLGFTSEIFLLPDEAFGIFLCQNRRVSAMRRELVDSILAEFFPAEASDTFAKPDSSVEVDVDAGTFLRVGIPSDTVEKLTGLLSLDAAVELRMDENESLYLDGTKKLDPIDSELFVDSAGTTLVGLGRDDKGDVADVFIGENAYTRVPWHQNPKRHRQVLLFATFIFVSGIVLLPFARPSANTSADFARGAKLMKTLLLLACGLNLLFIVVVVLEIVVASGSGWDYGLPRTLSLALYVPIVSGCVTLLAAAFVGAVWKKKPYSTFWMFHFVLVCISSLAFLVVLRHWNLVGH